MTGVVDAGGPETMAGRVEVAMGVEGRDFGASAVAKVAKSERRRLVSWRRGSSAGVSETVCTWRTETGTGINSTLHIGLV